ncbi:hypothetical protein AKJ41_03735 [candidate division MSBL1 archaeon SCGC-AAA259O05]|uniref:MoaD family protein n=1 Tax=candidate division MSBL1 archaeon SCGC-AAA259O05 TaxID=1698271 RepID=A0A133V2R6_9EURY|nr:hypothetical protein AKJ41_03735 [candidate division MSBL1 archaeon SCGC-AAA259O05]
MTVKVKFFANFREIIGCSEDNFSVDSVKELLKTLSETEKELSEKFFEDEENLELEDSVNIMVNGRKINLLDGINTELKDGDIVAIFPPVAGG